MANEALPVEERAESFSPAGLLSLNDRVAILMQEQTSRLYSLYTWQPGQQEMALVASNMYRAGDYGQLKDLQERLENLKEDTHIRRLKIPFRFLFYKFSSRGIAP